MIIEKMKKIEGLQSIKAVFAVKFGNITINDFKLIQQEGKKAWVGMPYSGLYR